MKRLLVLPALLVPVALAVTGCAADAPSAQPEDREPAVSAVSTVEHTPTPESKSKPARPTNLHLWKFDAPVVPLELSGRELVPPSDPSVLGWWGKRAGARRGTTLLTGHTVHTGGGMFDDLEETRVGDRAKVSGHSYEVTQVQVISKRALSRRAPVLFDQTGEAKVVLVTCEDYNPATGHYASNVVVTLGPLA